MINEVFYFPREIADGLEKYECTVLVSAPAHYRALGSTPVPKTSLRLAFSSGSPLEEAVAGRFHRETGIGIMEAYGSTETGGIATRCRALDQDHWIPMDVVDWKIANERICVRSPFVSPDMQKDQDGYAITGDRAMMNPDGTFDLLGRIDGIVKVAGKRVDLMEIEDKIQQIPSVKEACVFSVESPKARENEVVALLVSDEPEEELRRSMAQHLEPSAMPRRIKLVDRIPTTLSGKRDRRALLALFEE